MKCHFCCSLYSLYYSHQVFNDRDVLHPHTGQTVAVRYSADQQWYRGQVMQCTETSVQVILEVQAKWDYTGCCVGVDYFCIMQTSKDD